MESVAEDQLNKNFLHLSFYFQNVWLIAIILNNYNCRYNCLL